jgi:hypothetical protein
MYVHNNYCHRVTAHLQFIIIIIIIIIIMHARAHTHTEENLLLQRPFKLVLSPRWQATHSPARPLIACITTGWRNKTTAKDAAKVVREACRITS